jgi:hypothetical protein
MFRSPTFASAARQTESRCLAASGEREGAGYVDLENGIAGRRNRRPEGGQFRPINRQACGRIMAAAAALTRSGRMKGAAPWANAVANEPV